MSYVSYFNIFLACKYFNYSLWTLCSAWRPPNVPRTSCRWRIAPLWMSAIFPMMSSEQPGQHTGSRILLILISISSPSSSSSYQVCRHLARTGTTFHICAGEDGWGAQRLCGILTGAAQVGHALHQSGAWGATVSFRCQFRCHNFRVLRDGLFAKEDVSHELCVCVCVQ